MSDVYVEHERLDFWQLAEEPDGSYIDPLGPRDCMTHSASRMVMRITEGKRPPNTIGTWPPTGYAIRRACLDPNTGKMDTSGGVNHTQIKAAVKRLYGITLESWYGEPFREVIEALVDTRPVMLSLWYDPIRDTASRRGSFSFGENHEFFLSSVDEARGVFEDTVDPLADGRFAGIYHGPGDYSIDLLKKAAGMLNVASSGYRALGAGLCYALVGPATGAPPRTVRYHLSFEPGAFFVYDTDGRPFTDSRGVEYGGTITRRQSMAFRSATGAPSTGKRWYRWPGHGSRSLVRVTAGLLKDRFVSVPQTHVTLEVIR